MIPLKTLEYKNKKYETIGDFIHNLQKDKTLVEVKDILIEIGLDKKVVDVLLKSYQST